MNTKVVGGSLAALVMAGVMTACGGSSTPTSPDPNPGGGGGVGATLTITAAGVSPKEVTINVGQTVTLVNNGSKAYQISSNPHPSHGDCPALNFGGLDVGQTRTSNAFTAARTCGYHDHSDPGNAALQGQVTVR